MLILRNDDLDRARCRPEFVRAMLEDLRGVGCVWTEGPDVGGPHAPYDQSARLPIYMEAFQRLRAAGVIYPCVCSRQGVLRALTAPHQGDEEPLYPGTCRGHSADVEAEDALRMNWRFRVPDGETVGFIDGHSGPQRAVTGIDFGDFLVWRKDGFPSYQLACAVDDAEMRITEVVRGADLITSTFRQLLLFRALEAIAPTFFHCPLVTDEHGTRLAKRNDALSLRTLRAEGKQPEELRA
jgi:glutamyl-tRNA synthetase